MGIKHKHPAPGRAHGAESKQQLPPQSSQVGQGLCPWLCPWLCPGTCQEPFCSCRTPTGLAWLHHALENNKNKGTALFCNTLYSPRELSRFPSQHTSSDLSLSKAPRSGFLAQHRLGLPQKKLHVSLISKSSLDNFKAATVEQVAKTKSFS